MSEILPRLAAALSDRYRIERELGEGGMATVYLAEDLKHDRKVALKVLKPELAAVLGADRFLAEIKTTAALQHPNILPLFDSGTADGLLYYVMPYVEGESLRDKLDRETQLSVDEAVALVREVADGLEYAHEHGVVHRDIKPENILIHAGRPMVADFGIALAVSAAAGGRMTETGLSLGTPHYMSPEQATAEKTITNRSDIYSLGAVLYEMLTGEPPHTGTSAQQIIAKIVTEEVAPVTKQRKSVPANVAAAVSEALEKLPADRFESATAFAEALADPAFRYGAAATSAVAGRRRPRWLWAWAVAATVAAVALGAGLALRSRTPRAAGPVMQFDVTLPPHLTPYFGAGVNFDVSPDGSKVVFVGSDSAGTQDLWLRASDRIMPVRLLGTDGARDPRFSPDGRSVAYIAGDSLNTVSLTGAPPVAVVPDSGEGGLAWGSEGYLYYRRRSGGIWRVPAAGGKSERLLAPGSGGSDEWVDALPNGRGVLFSIDNPGDPTQTRVAVLDARTGRVKILLRATMARFAPPGDLLYTTAQGELLSVPFDVSHLSLTGSPHPVLDGIQINTGSASYFAASASGALLYGTGIESMPTPVWISAGGSTAAFPVLRQGEFVIEPSVSPDGRRVAFVLLKLSDRATDIWIYDVAQRTFSPLTLDGHADAPFWSPDGTEIGYRSRAPGAEGIYERRADFSGQAHRLVPAKEVTGPASYRAAWMPDGRTLLYVDSAGHLLSVSPGGHAAPRLLLGPNATVRSFSLSPDGRRVAYDSDVSGSYQVYVAPVSGHGGRIQVSVSGGYYPVWTRDGAGIVYYVSAGNAWMLATVRTRPAFAVVSRRKFADAGDYGLDAGWFDTAPDGRIVAIRYGPATNTPSVIRFVTDWRRAFGVGR